MEQLDASATSAEKDFIYGADLLAQADSGGGLGYLLGDHLGSTRLLTDSGGSAITNTAFDYSPYGDPLGTSGSSLTDYPHAFTGQWRDETLGMQFHRARWMSGMDARWIAIDPIADWSGNFSNGYTYCGKFPLNAKDNSGMFVSLVEITGTLKEICQNAIQNIASAWSTTSKLRKFLAVGRKVFSIVQRIAEVIYQAWAIVIVNKQIPNMISELEDTAIILNRRGDNEGFYDVKMLIAALNETKIRITGVAIAEAAIHDVPYSSAATSAYMAIRLISLSEELGLIQSYLARAVRFRKSVFILEAEWNYTNAGLFKMLVDVATLKYEPHLTIRKANQFITAIDSWRILTARERWLTLEEDFNMYGSFKSSIRPHWPWD